MAEQVRIALAGNPNSGKTTMFNALTGSRQRVGNYPGITVERKEGSVSLNGLRAEVVDLPGCYSLTAYSEEELVARKVLVEERPDVVVSVLDSTVLERSLYLAVQLMEMGVPLVLALNMMDEAKKRGLRIDSAALSRLLGVPVVETIGRTGQGKEELLRTADKHARVRQRQWRPLEISYGPDVDPALIDMTKLITEGRLFTERQPARWTAIKYIEGDEQVVAEGRKASPELSKELEAMVAKLAEHCQKTLNTHPDAIIADYRYGYIASVLKQGVLERDTLRERIDFTDKVDRVLTHRLAGPLIMIAVLYGMFKATFIVGEYPMGWLEGFFGWLGGVTEGAMAEGPLRSLLVSGIIDGVGAVMGFVPLILVMFLFISVLEDLGYMARMAYMLDRVMRMFGLHGCSVMPFVLSGGIAGGCAVPGVMATRTLKSPKEKLATLVTAPFMNCGAKVPVFLLLAAAFFPDNAAGVMFIVTLSAWVIALLVSKLLRSTVLRGESTPFVMELPPYRLPTLRGVLIHTWDRIWAYIRRAGTVILAVSILLWAAMTYPGLPENQEAAFETLREQATAQVQGLEDSEAAEAELEELLADIDNQEAQAALRHSAGGRMGIALEPLTALAGFDWRTNIALVGGFAAKEVIVSTMGMAYSLGEVDEEEPTSLSEQLSADPYWTKATAISLMVFVLLYAPCFATLITMARESSWRWAVFSMIFNTGLAFTLAVVAYQIGRLL